MVSYVRRIRPSTRSHRAVAVCWVLAFGGPGAGSVHADEAQEQSTSQADETEREVSPGLRKTVAKVLDEWRRAIGAGDPAAVAAVLDARELFEHSHALAPLAAYTEPREVLRFVQRTHADLATAGEPVWTELEILRAVVGSEPGRLVVTTRATIPAKGPRPAWSRDDRWYFFKRDGAWRVAERLDLCTGAALSWRAARAFDAAPEKPPWVEQIDAILRGAESLREGDVEGLGWALDVVDGLELPGPIEGTVDMMRAERALASGRSQAALGWARAASGLLGDLPGIARLQAQARIELGDFGEALAAVRAYESSLPADAELCFLRGRAAAALGRLDVAADAFRAGLGLDPQSVDNLLGLARSVGPEGEQDLRDRFRRLEEPTEWFETLVLDLFESGDLEDVEALIGELRNIAPTDPNGDYYEAALLMQRGDVRAAADLLREAFPKVSDPNELRFYVQQYVDACVQLGVPLEAYEEAPDSSFVFDLLCSWFLSSGHLRAIEELALRHELDYPDDPWLPYYRAELLRAEGELSTAALRYEEGLLNSRSDEVREVYRWNLVRSRIELGEPMRAYDEIGPREATYRQLVRHALDEGASGLLDTLMARRRADEPGDPALVALEGVRTFWQGDYAHALEQLAPVRDDLDGDDPVLAHAERAYILSAIRTGALSRAERAARASTRRDGDPLFEALVYAAKGEHARCLEALGDCLRLGYDPATLYLDPDLGPALREEEAYASFRTRYPVPVESETGRPDEASARSVRQG